MEDVDLVVGDRNQGASGSLLDFLVALDGAMSDHVGVVTIATTNDVGAIDPAAKRASRFDVVIDVPHPDETGRAAILERYLRDVPGAVRIERVVAATAGFSGADLRELVSDAVLHLAARGADVDPGGGGGSGVAEAGPELALLTTALLVGWPRTAGRAGDRALPVGGAVRRRRPGRAAIGRGPRPGRRDGGGEGQASAAISAAMTSSTEP
jgi:hypothetical protein